MDRSLHYRHGLPGEAAARVPRWRAQLNQPLHIVLRCADALTAKVRYVFDTLFMAAGVEVAYALLPPASGPWILYGPAGERRNSSERCLAIHHCEEAWRLFEGAADVWEAGTVDGLRAVFSQRGGGLAPPAIGFDIIANAFYFLSSWAERVEAQRGQTRRLHVASVFARLEVPQDIVDRYLARVMGMLDALCDRIGYPRLGRIHWPDGAGYALVLSHDVDFIPSGVADILKQGVKTVLRHLMRQRDPGDALRSVGGLWKAVASRRDPYGCVPEIIARERELGVRASFQVAVGHRHPDDVNYRLEDARVRDYLQVIPDSGFDLCLHGSYRSTENPRWYVEEVGLLSERLARPLGSRQHFLSFDYDTLFSAQEEAGIQYDMSMGFPDRIGPRAGFSYPYFPYCLKEDRPYDVVQISLFLMDVTLRGYMRLKGARAWEAVEGTLADLRGKGGCASVVWHPIVFGGARDPGYDRLFWDMVEHVRATGGLATDGRTLNTWWRDRARAYPSFAALGRH